MTVAEAVETWVRPAVQVDGAWQNPIPTPMMGFGQMLKLLPEMFRSDNERMPKRPLVFRTDSSAFLAPPASGLRVTLFGHSSLLLEIDGTTILTDPVWCDRASMVQWAGPKRFFPAPLRVDELPPLDAVLLSHDHYDHLDSHTIPLLKERTTRFVCSLGVDDHLKRWGIPASQIDALNWTDDVTVGNGLRITALPARHFTGRGLKRFTTLWSSFALRSAKHNVYFGADSGPWPGFKEIGERYGRFDLAMLEVGAWNERWGTIHLGPQHASEAFQQLNARVMMPIHWGLFNLAFHDWYQPAEASIRLAADADYPLFLPQPGKPTEFTGEQFTSYWWR